jgi:hypothetical protein
LTCDLFQRVAVRQSTAIEAGCNWRCALIGELLTRNRPDKKIRKTWFFGTTSIKYRVNISKPIESISLQIAEIKNIFRKNGYKANYFVLGGLSVANAYFHM